MVTTQPSERPKRRDCVKTSWRGVPVKERVDHFKSIWISTVPLEQVKAVIRDKAAKCKLCEESEGVLIIIESGGGKTALVSQLKMEHPDDELDDRSIRPIVELHLPNPCTSQKLDLALLNAIGVQDATSTRAFDRKDRAINLMSACQTIFVVVDNFQDVPEHRDKGGVRKIGNWFRDLIDDRRVSILLVLLGTKEARAVRVANTQVRRRAMTVMQVDYFRIDSAETIRLWRTFLKDYDLNLPLADLCCLEEPAMAVRLFIACNGILDFLRELILEAILIVVPAGRERIDILDLEVAYKKVHCDVAKGGNPFATDFNRKSLTSEGDAFFQMERGSAGRPGQHERQA